jgi:hypothetical protein
MSLSLIILYCSIALSSLSPSFANHIN